MLTLEIKKEEDNIFDLAEAKPIVREILVGMVIPMTQGHRKFRIAMCTISGIFKQKYCEYMSGLRDETVSQLKS